MIIDTSILYFRLFITVLLCLIGFIIPKNKIIFVIQSLWLTIITIFNTYSVDWLGNEQLYEKTYFDSSTNFSNFAYNLVVSLSKNLGLSFTQFNGVMSFIATSLIIVTVLKYSKNPNLVLSFWYIFPFIDNIIQKRAYYALGLTCIAMPLLLKKKNRVRNYIIFEIIAIVASQFHELVLFYLTLPPFLLIKEKWRKFFILFLIVMELIGKNYLVSMINGVTGGSKSSYFEGAYGNISLIVLVLLVIWQLAQLVIVYFLNKDSKNSILLSINIWALTLLPLYSFGAVFTRVFRTVIFCNDIGIANELKLGRFLKLKSLLIITSQVIVLLVGFIITDLNGIGGISNMIYTIFQNNWLLI